MNKCLIKKQKKLLWWKWEINYEEHNWVYFRQGEEKFRKCQTCGRIETLWRDYYKDGFRHEDWRISKLEDK